VPGNPKQCREHARQCALLAKDAVTPDARQIFLSLECSWLKLADELEASQAFLKAVNSPLMTAHSGPKRSLAESTKLGLESEKSRNEI
jgi:hypothetical protein